MKQGFSGQGAGKKIKLVVSDIHLGSGYMRTDGLENFNEDFHYDYEFAGFLDYYSSGKYNDLDVELIFNGDTFEMFETSEYSYNPEEMSDSMSLQRLSRIIKGHRVFFDALAAFVGKKNKSVRFITGNHDYELLNESFQAKLRERLGPNVLFSENTYAFNGVHIEHGHQHIPFTAHNLETRHITSHGTGEEITNHSFGALFSFKLIYKYKDLASFYPLHRVFPMGKAIRRIFMEKPLFAIRYLFDVCFFFIKAVFVYKKKFIFPDNGIFRKIFKSMELDMRGALDRKAVEVLRRPGCSAVIFGHTHYAKMQFLGEKKVYVNTGSWTNEVDLSMIRPGTWTILSYAYLEVTLGLPLIELKEWKGLAHPDRTIMSNWYY